MPGGAIYVREAETGDGQYAIVVSDRPYGKTEADAAYRVGHESPPGGR